MKRKLFLALLALGLLTLAAPWAMAEQGAEYCFSQSDFVSDTVAVDGIFLTQVPDDSMGTLFLGNRALRAGDVIPSSLLEQLVLRSASPDGGEATMAFCAITSGHVEENVLLKVSVASAKNEAPTAKNSSLETYKNIANQGTLSATDPEGDKLTYTLKKAPKKGTVDLQEDGSFTYTPSKNKVGKDSFTYLVTDSAGNRSNEATVSIEILKPTDKATFSDMKGQSGEFYALWMKEEGLYGGESIAEKLCFSPDKPVTRGEFLVMSMKLLGAEPADAMLTSGFADEEETAGWLRPYIVTALRCGIVTGLSSPEGRIFSANSFVSEAECAVMLGNMLGLSGSGEKPVFATDSTVPAWAEDSYSALACAGISLSDSQEAMSRLEVAELLYEVQRLTESNKELNFPWK